MDDISIIVSGCRYSVMYEHTRNKFDSYSKSGKSGHYRNVGILAKGYLSPKMTFEGVSKIFRTESITKYTLTTINIL
jgi:hypothetical protein